VDRTAWIVVIAFLGLAVVVGILVSQSDVSWHDGHDATQAIVHQPSPVRALSPDERALVAANTEFAFDLYRAVREDGRNLVFSPYGVSMALSMVYTGSHGVTEDRIARALHLEFAPFDLPAVFAGLQSRFRVSSIGSFRLRLTNSLWWQEGFDVRQLFIDTLRRNLGATIESLDFSASPESARDTINGWASRETDGQIRELFPSGTITALTRFLVANAITFRAAWETPFNTDYTRNGTFTLLDGRQVAAPMMNQIDRFAYVATDGSQAVELPYEGGRFSMLVLLPAEGQFEEFAGSLAPDCVTEILETLSMQWVQIHMPRFGVQTALELSDVLGGLGMTDAFTLGRADFRGMTFDPEFFLGEVAHQTQISVDEDGTYAMAATAAEMVGPSVPTVRLDRPFLFLIRDIETETILLIGQVVDPTAR